MHAYMLVVVVVWCRSVVTRHVLIMRKCFDQGSASRRPLLLQTTRFLLLSFGILSRVHHTHGYGSKFQYSLSIRSDWNVKSFLKKEKNQVIILKLLSCRNSDGLPNSPRGAWPLGRGEDDCPWSPQWLSEKDPRGTDQGTA